MMEPSDIAKLRMRLALLTQRIAVLTCACEIHTAHRPSLSERRANPASMHQWLDDGDRLHALLKQLTAEMALVERDTAQQIAAMRQQLARRRGGRQERPGTNSEDAA